MIIREDLRGSLNEVLNECRTSPTDKRFQEDVYFGPGNAYSVRIWAPIEIHQLTIYCPQHTDTELKIIGMTDNFLTDQRNDNPRLILGLSRNVVLVQAIYSCNMCSKTIKSDHRSLKRVNSTAQTLLCLLSEEVKSTFRVNVYSKYALKHEVIDYLFNHIPRGLNFSQIARSIADMHLCEYTGRLREDIEKFKVDHLYQFPNDQFLIDIFKDIFMRRKDVYDEAVQKPAIGYLACDHTFEVGKNIGGIRDVGGFVTDKQSAFIAMDEERNVVGWNLTKGEGHAEARSCLDEIKARLKSPLQYVLVDNCCSSRYLYIAVFGENIVVKLDVFHAVQRLCKCISKKDPNKAYISSKLGLFVRQSDDQGPIRMKDTADEEEMEANLKSIVRDLKASGYLDSMKPTKRITFENEIKNILEHVREGCLSRIKPGHGTEHNENLHRLLKQSFLRGSGTVGPEIAKMVLSLIFYVINKKKDNFFHEKNQKIALVTHPQTYSSDLPSSVVPPSTSNDKESPQNLSSDFIKNMSHIAALVGNHKQAYLKLLPTIKTRGIRLQDLFPSFDFLPYSLEDMSEATHGDRIQRNLMESGCILDPTRRDGDSVFRSVVKQLSYTTHSEDTSSYLLNLGLTPDAEEDAAIPRLRMKLDETLKNETDNDMPCYNENGMFVPEMGAVVIRKLCNILKMVIVVVTSGAGKHYHPFIPEEQLPADYSLLTIAYNIGQQHYSATKQLINDNTGCLCRRTPGNNGCGTSSCKCIKNGAQCDTKCHCKGYCGNKSPQENVKQKCSCGRTPSKTPVASCAQIENRVSRCKCLINNQPCSDECSCRGCQNPNGALQLPKATKKRTGKDNLKKYNTKVSAAEYAKNNNTTLAHGTWTDDETILLIVLRKISTEMETNEDQIVHQVHNMYQRFLRYNTAKNLFQIRVKSVTQVKGKMKSWNDREKFEE